MTTVRQVQRVAQPLLARNADLSLVNRLIVIKPVNHFMRGIYLSKTAQTDRILPCWLVTFLFGTMGISFTWGEPVKCKLENGWFVDHPEMPLALCEAIETTVLPELRAIRTIDDFTALTSTDRFFPWNHLDELPEYKIFTDAARGDFSAADKLCDYFIRDETKQLFKSEMMEEEYDLIANRLCKLIATRDRQGIVRLLRDREAKTVKRLRLTKIWQQTPFPIEADV